MEKIMEEDLLENEEVNDEQSIQVRFITQQKEYAIPTVLYSVSAISAAAELSDLINTVLREASEEDGEEARNISFDFRLGDGILRTTLDKFIEENLLSKESVLELEYFAKEAAPEPWLSCPHPDWVAAISSIKTETDTLFLTGCYDGSVNMWSLADGLVATAQYHTAPVKSVTLVQSSGDIVAVSGSHDQTVTMAKVLPASSRANDWEIQPVVLGRGHAGSIDCVGASPNLQRVATGSWDTMLKVWDLNLKSESEVSKNEQTVEIGELEADNPESKKGKTHKRKLRKRDNDEEHGSSLTKARNTVPLVTLSGHSEGISDLTWMSDSELVTAGFDHALVFWDMLTGQEKSKIPGVRAFLSISYSPLSSCILTTSTDRHIRLYDPRSNDGSLVKSTFTSHSTWVSSVEWASTSPSLFISGSYDNLMKLWDIRSPKVSLFDMSGHEDKILDVCWSPDNYLASASADTTMKIFSKRQ